MKNIFETSHYEEQKRIVENVIELMSLCNALAEKLMKKKEEVKGWLDYMANSENYLASNPEKI